MWCPIGAYASLGLTFRLTHSRLFPVRWGVAQLARGPAGLREKCDDLDRLAFDAGFPHDADWPLTFGAATDEQLAMCRHTLEFNPAERVSAADALLLPCFDDARRSYAKSRGAAVEDWALSPSEEAKARSELQDLGESLGSAVARSALLGAFDAVRHVRRC